MQVAMKVFALVLCSAPLCPQASVEDLLAKGDDSAKASVEDLCARGDDSTKAKSLNDKTSLLQTKHVMKPGKERREGHIVTFDPDLPQIPGVYFDPEDGMCTSLTQDNKNGREFKCPTTLMKKVPEGCEEDTGGTCNHFNCYAWRGDPKTEVQCKREVTPAWSGDPKSDISSCICRDGYCAEDGKCIKQENLKKSVKTDFAVGFCRAGGRGGGVWGYEAKELASKATCSDGENAFVCHDIAPNITVGQTGMLKSGNIVNGKPSLMCIAVQDGVDFHKGAACISGRVSIKMFKEAKKLLYCCDKAGKCMAPEAKFQSRRYYHPKVTGNMFNPGMYHLHAIKSSSTPFEMPPQE